MIFRPASSRPEPGELDPTAGGRWCLRPLAGAVDLGTFDPRRATVSTRLARIPRRIIFPDGTCFQTDDNDGVDALCGIRGPLGVAALLDRRLGLAALVGVLALAVVLGFHRFVLPAAAGLAASLTSQTVVDRMREPAWRVIEAVTAPTALPADRQAALSALFERVANASAVPDARLMMRGGGDTGSNAFALPDGTVVLTDQLASMAEADALAGVFAHELAHVELRHGLARLYRSIGVTTVLMLVTGGAGAVGDLGSLAAGAAELSYTRADETEADLRAVAILDAAGIPAEPFARLLEDFATLCPACERASWLTSHPASAERAAAVRAAARR